jgi:protein SCO1/2
MRRLLPLFLCLLTAACHHAAAGIGKTGEDDEFGPIGSFGLTERSGREITQDDLLGKAWVASFVFTRCTGPCPQVTASVARLQSELAAEPNLRFVTFTVDPEHDNPGELRRYAEHFSASPERWLFLTGKENVIYDLLRHGFHVHAEQNQGTSRKPGAEVMHDTHLVAVDKKGHIRGYYSGIRDTRDRDPDEAFEASFRQLRDKLTALAHEAP